MRLRWQLAHRTSHSAISLSILAQTTCAEIKVETLAVFPGARGGRSRGSGCRPAAVHARVGGEATDHDIAAPSERESGRGSGDCLALVLVGQIVGPPALAAPGLQTVRRGAPPVEIRQRTIPLAGVTALVHAVIVAAASDRMRPAEAGWGRLAAGPLAQLVEQRAFNPRVVRSSRTRPTSPAVFGQDRATCGAAPPARCRRAPAPPGSAGRPARPAWRSRPQVPPPAP